MKADELYARLSEDFEIEKYKDAWGPFLELSEFINPEFKKRWIGVMLDNANVIEKVYTAVFPDTPVLDRLLGSNKTDILLFSHHAMGYDPTLEGFPFHNIPVAYLKRLKKRRISFYVSHIPLDKNGPYSTSVNLAKALKLPVVSEFCEYLGCKVGVICETSYTRLADLALHVEKNIGHEVRVRQYGGETIEKGRVGIAAGGGCIDFVAREILALGLNTLLTGCTRPIPSFEPNMEFHRIAEANGINLISATHYSTEKYACMAMTSYFRELGLEAEFVEGTPCMEDM